MPDCPSVPISPASTPGGAAAEVPLWVDELTASALPKARNTPLWMADLPGAGWYPDPLDPARVRYWGGFVWQEATVPTLTPGAGAAPATERFPIRGGRSDARRAPVRAALFSTFGGAGGAAAPRHPNPASLIPRPDR